jgi:hypothetical protein
MSLEEPLICLTVCKRKMAILQVVFFQPEIQRRSFLLPYSSYSMLLQYEAHLHMRELSVTTLKRKTRQVSLSVLNERSSASETLGRPPASLLASKILIGRPSG